jgi:hypothetical protein
MTRTSTQTVLPSLALAAITLAGAPASATGFTEALTGGTPNLDVRLRYESVDQAGFADKAEGLTVRARLGYATGNFAGFGAMAEFEHTKAFFANNRVNSSAGSGRLK